MLIHRYLYTYWYLYLSQISRRSSQDLCLYRGTLSYYKADTYTIGLYLYDGDYTCLEVPVGSTEILRNVYWYCETYPYTEVLVSTTKLILVLCILDLYYSTYTCISDLLLVLQSIYLSYGSYTCVTELILVFRILYGAYSCTKVPVGTTQIHYTKVPKGTTGLILQNLYLFY